MRFSTETGPTDASPATVFLIAATRLANGWSRSVEPPPVVVPELPLTRSCAVWIALLVILALAAPRSPCWGSPSGWVLGGRLRPPGAEALRSWIRKDSAEVGPGTDWR
ncbi:MAG: hypothetical protein JXB62_13730 [Pirellulales bacterium]|nr:hypothetical protein [Pirellulales bacterium]